MNKIKLGIIGIGNMGTAHTKNIISGRTPDIELVAVADIKAERLEWANKELPETVKIFKTGEELLNSGLVDSVIIAVPHYDHPKYTIMALEKGINVMCEKPAGVYTKQVREMNDAAEKSDKVFAMMFNQRTNPVYIKMREMVKSGKFGAIKRVNWIITDWYRTQAYYDSGEWRATWSGEGGGVLLNQCPHQLDLFQWICGMPKKVTTQMHFGKWHDIEVEDDVTAYLEFENGATGVFITSTGDAPGTNRFEISLEKGKLIAEGGKLLVWESDVNERDWVNDCKEGYTKPEYKKYEADIEGENTGHVGVLNAFADNILSGKPLIADGKEGINGLILSNAMHLSGFLGRTVEIPFDEELYYEELMKRVKDSHHKTHVHEQTVDIHKTY